MENVFFTAEPVIILFLTIVTVSLIILGRKLEMPYFPVTVVLYSLGFLVYHTIGVNKGMEVSPQLYFSIAVDLVMLFLGFFAYLWVDNIAAKNKNLKSYGDPLAWFWEKL